MTANPRSRRYDRGFGRCFFGGRGNDGAQRSSSDNRPGALGQPSHRFIPAGHPPAAGGTVDRAVLSGHLPLPDPCQLQPGRSGLVACRHGAPGAQPGRQGGGLVCRSDPVSVWIVGLSVLIFHDPARAGRISPAAPRRSPGSHDAGRHGQRQGHHQRACRSRAGERTPRAPGALCLGALDRFHFAARRLQCAGGLAPVQPAGRAAAGARRAAGRAGGRPCACDAGGSRGYAGAAAADRHRFQPGHRPVLDVGVRTYWGGTGRQCDLGAPEAGRAGRPPGRGAGCAAAWRPAGSTAANRGSGWG